MSENMAVAVVSKVREGSIADLNNVKKSDVLLRLNGRRIKDIISYRYYASDDFVTVDMSKDDGTLYSFNAIDCSSYALGMEFEDVVFDKVKRCSNKCIFCFEDQLPKDARESLKIKDDDYRLSFLSGNFITLTNLDDLDFNKIRKMRLSPLYVSVHATEDEVRSFMLGRPYKERILSTLAKLISWNIELHIQIVLVPNVNDDKVLSRTLGDLMDLGEKILSVGIVPVGLTRHRENLYNIKPVSTEVAVKTIDIVEDFAALAKKNYGRHIFYAADEFYIKAGLVVPVAKRYDNYPQIENGIGLYRQFVSDFGETMKISKAELMNKSFLENKKRFVITGILAKDILKDAIDTINGYTADMLEICAITNSYFGEKINVAGLVVGSDIIGTLTNKITNDYAEIIIPDVMLKKDRYTFLDDLTVDDIKKALNINVTVLQSSGDSLVKYMISL